jgi:hypothetical protein
MNDAATRRPIDQDALTEAHKAVEDVLIELRDLRVSVLTANGLVVRESDGTESSIMRLGTREGLEIGLRAYLDALERDDG